MLVQGGLLSAADRDHHHRDHRDHSGLGATTAADNDGVAAFAAKFANLEDVAGQLMSVAQDQNGCRFLQRKFDEGGAASIEKVGRG